MSIDWAATGAWMQAWAGFAGAGAVLWVGLKGADTYRLWLRQKQTERRIAVAERILTLTYRLKRAFTAIRSPGSFGYEHAAAEELLKEHDSYAVMETDQKKRAQLSQIILTRVRSYKDDWDELFACLPLARAFFGQPIEDALEKLWKQQVSISVSAEMYWDDQPDPAFKRKLEADFWEGFSDRRIAEDEVGKNIKDAVAIIENAMIPMLASEVNRPLT